MANQPIETFEQKPFRETLERFTRIVADLQEEVKEIKRVSYTAESSRGRRNQDEEWEDEELVEEFETSGIRNPTRARRGSKQDTNLGSIKLKILTFNGKNDPEAFLEWVEKVDSIYNVHNYSEEKKIKLAVVEFTSYARNWWNKVLAQRRRDDEGPIETWEEMKRLMRKRFIPPQYYRDMFNKLQKITQGSRSVEEYYQELEVAMLRVKLEEDPEASMARFLGGLRHDIAHIVEMHEYEDLEEMYHKALKDEKQLKEKRGSRANTSTTTSNWRNSWPKKEFTSSPKKAESSGGAKGSVNSSNNKPKDFKSKPAREILVLSSLVRDTSLHNVLTTG